jgi:hypothetical protein
VQPKVYPPYLRTRARAAPEIAAAKQRMRAESPVVLVAMLLLVAVAFVGLGLKVFPASAPECIAAHVCSYGRI